MANKINQSQRTFCEEYLKSGNATQAYKMAYSSCKTEGAARVGGAKLLTKPNIREYIDTVNQATTTANILTITEIKELYTRIALDQEQDAHARIKAANSLEKLVGMTNFEQKRIYIEESKLKLQKQQLKQKEQEKKQEQQQLKDGIKIVMSTELESWGK